jgi:hypothetical protein
MLANALEWIFRLFGDKITIEQNEAVRNYN